MAKISPLLLLLLLNLLLPSQSETVHDLLQQYGLPRGLLPDSVKSYSLSSNGDFVVEVTAPCYVHFADLVYYDKKITGKLSYGHITDISGIQVKKFFAWLPVTGIGANPAAGAIELQVGFLSEKLPSSLFADVPTCRSRVAGCRGAAGVLKEEASAVAEV